MKTREEAIKWIISQDWYKKFRENYRIQRDSYTYPVKSKLTIYLSKNKLDLLIINAFSWSGTVEGFHFWDIINNEYWQFLNS